MQALYQWDLSGEQVSAIRKQFLEDEDFFEFKISCKASDVFLAVAAYVGLAEACDYPLHIGVTEAGGLRSGTVKSSIGLGNLLWSGIGDTLRVSLSADPVEEVKVGFDMLKALGLRHRGVNVVSCPSCARQQFEVIKTVELLEQRLAHITTPLIISVILGPLAIMRYSFQSLSLTCLSSLVSK